MESLARIGEPSRREAEYSRGLLAKIAILRKPAYRGDGRCGEGSSIGERGLRLPEINR